MIRHSVKPCSIAAPGRVLDRVRRRAERWWDGVWRVLCYRPEKRYFRGLGRRAAG